MVFFLLSWITFYHLASLPSQRSLSLFLFRLSGASVFLFVISYYFFIVRWFLNKKGFYKFLGRFFLIYSFLFGWVTIFTNHMIVSLGFEQEVIFPVFSSWGWVAFYGYATIFTILINIVLLKSYFTASAKRKLKIQYFLIGMLIFAVVNFIVDIILPVFFKSYRFFQLAHYSDIFIIIFTTLAIVKQKLFGIKVILTQLLIASIAFLLLFNFFTSQNTFEYIWKGTLFVVFLIFGWLLVKSVVREIKQREEINKYAGQLGVANVKLKKTYVKLQKLDKAKSEFISIASHQLRTPLTAVKGYISMIIEGDYGKMPKEAVRPMHNVYASNERLIKLVNSLLNLSRLEAGKIKIEKAKFAVQDMLKSIVVEFSSQAKERGIKLTFAKPKEKIPIVNADQQKLRQVVANLIDNALKYTEQGSVKVTLSKEKKNVKILVIDTGEGMTEEELGQVFESFSRAGAGKRMFIEGAGLGLYVARKFITMQKGKIWAESAGKGKGSTFHILLPIK